MPGKPAASARPPKDPDAYPDERPAHRVRLPRFFIARYPVTVGQWRAYHRATGTPVNAWSLEGEANHPVVDVSWREAVGYCAWLTDAMRRRARVEAARPAESRRAVPEVLATLLLEGDGGSGPWAVTLPSEAEWERTARGTKGRRYACGDRIDRNLANYRGERWEEEGVLWAVSAVGCFVGGRTPDSGVEDLAGNVWEWTRSEMRDCAYDRTEGRGSMELSSASRRVVRGGSFSVDRRNVRAACRDGLDPDFRSSYVGFRVVIDQFSH